MILLLVALAVCVYLVFQLTTTILPRQFLVPPHNWRDKILKVINYPKPIYLATGTKRSAYRRRLVLASCQPSFYTNYVNNKIKVQPQDALNTNNDFIDQMKRRDAEDPQRPLIFGFFHPYANNGGGGERVLWEAVQATLLAHSNNIVAIYTTNNDSEPLAILQKARDKFHTKNLDSRRIVFVYLRKFGRLIDGDYWKHFTIVGQLMGLALLSLEALYELSPDVFVDTMGLPGLYFFVSMALKIPIMSYVHYPILQLEMFGKLKFGDFLLQTLKWFNWSPQDWRQLAKLVYWLVLYHVYVFLGSLVDITLTNGTWTQSHIASIWTLNVRAQKKVDILYPPCGDLDVVHPAIAKRDNIMLYIAQFRPEKRHALILQQYAAFLAANKRAANPKLVPLLVFLGSCRTADDTSILKSLQTQVTQLELNVTFVVDCSYDEVLNWLGRVKYGLNAMWNEHFGIGVVEYLSSGVIPIVHASAGPFLDIVTGYEQQEGEYPAWRNNTGFFFKDESDPDYDGRTNESGFMVFGNGEFPSFSQLLEEILVKDTALVREDALASMRSNGAHLVAKFSNRTFLEKWMAHLVELQHLERAYRERRSGIETVY